MIGRPLQIGPVRLETNLLLAPVANYCDLAFRIVARSCGGVGLACTDLLSPHGLLKGTARSLDLARTHDLDKPVGMQLYGRDHEILADGARWAVDHGATVIDINMGCPVDKVAKKNGGSLLLCHPDSTIRLTERVRSAVDKASAGRVPLTCKVRLGWDNERIVAPALAAAFREIGVAAMTVHGRTTDQRFKGDVRLNGIRAVVEAAGAMPVIGNGDVASPEACLRMLRETGCAGVMIGRGAFSAPWIFRDCWAAQTSGVVPAEPTREEKIDIIRRYFEYMLEFRSERYALVHIGRRISWFAKRLPPCKPFKEAIRTARSAEDVRAALDQFESGGLSPAPRRAALAPLQPAA